jgi:hypothetical protein
MTWTDEQSADLLDIPNGSCPVHATGLELPHDFVLTPLQYVD